MWPIPERSDIDEQYIVDDWIELTKFGADIAVDQTKPATLVVADEIVIDSKIIYSNLMCKYDNTGLLNKQVKNAPKTIYLIARHIVIKSPFYFYSGFWRMEVSFGGLEPWREVGKWLHGHPDGGDLMIIADKLTIEQEGIICFISVAHSNALGRGYGGKITIATREFNLVDREKRPSDEIKKVMGSFAEWCPVIAQNTGDSVTCSVDNGQLYHFVRYDNKNPCSPISECNDAFYFISHDGPLGIRALCADHYCSKNHQESSENTFYDQLERERFFLVKGFSGLTDKKTDGLIKRLVTEWKIAVLSHAISYIQNAQLRSSPQEILRQVERVHTMPFQDVPVAPFLSARFEQAMSKLRSLEEELLPPVTRSTCVLQRGMGTFEVPIFQLRADMSCCYLAPTDALVAPASTRAQESLGQVWIDPQHPDRLFVQFMAELSVDPRPLAQASDLLAKRGLRCGGMFRRWRLFGGEMQATGLLAVDAQVANDTVLIVLSIDRETGGLALQWLGSDHGLPLILRYECSDAAQVTGRLGINISFRRRKSPQINIQDGFLVNHGQSELTVDAILCSGQPMALSPAIVLAAGDRLPVPLAAAATEVAVLPHAVAYTGRLAHSLDDFQAVHLGELTVTVSVENLLPTRDVQRDLVLDHVEVTILFSMGTGEKRYEAHAGPFNLTAAGRDGAICKATFIRLRQESFACSVRGNVYWDGGQSHAAFQTSPSDDVTIKIDAQLLPSV